ncbi:zinc finger SWIM domain-containing protein 3 isoform X2 [Grus americana]|uniref:zinc finger SWIM domain-containing protein 3 isoform X2 n=1 Tax=Grus americana TaxID=9117 RepID=UPI0024083F74|nr:zinc finger SWIM domain-containing protein 3 isoform X2 [Grus americana]
MEVGACFRNYEDFRQRFRAYKLAQRCRYGLRSCVSVRCHNRQHGTAVREDVMFMQVKFGCARTQKYSKKRKQQPSLCPAYFVLQYNEDIDRLVISELNDDHVHADPVFSLSRATAATASTTACSSPTAKLCKQQQVLLSVYHTVRLLEKSVKEAEISSSFKENLTLALHKAVFSPSAANLDALSQLVKCVVSPELYDYLQANWFSCELLWCMHREKGLYSCGTHMDSLDLITHRISGLFGQQPSLEASVLCFLECADSLDSRGLESLNWDFSSTEDGGSSLWEKPNTHTGAAAEPGPVSGCPTLAERPEPAKPAAAAGMGCMLAALRESCTDLGYWLCLKEWEVVQTSTQLLSPTPGGLVVRLLEDAHRVSRDCRSCSCCFHRRYRLPCRHILAVLQAHRGRVEEGMVCRRWQRRYQQLPVPGDSLPGHGGGLVGGQGERVQSLSLELANLLMQCEGEELEERSSALSAILAAWARSPGPGEAAGKEPVPPHCSG